MFTGLVEEMGIIKGIEKGSKSAQLNIGAKKILEDINLGDSIAVNGACLTVIDFTEDSFTVDVMAETLDKTTLGALTKGKKVNLERAMAMGHRFGGHFVTGHVDGIGEIIEQKWIDIAQLVKVRTPEHLMPFLIEKGSITIDGVSLTVIQVENDFFTTSLIPLTRDETILGDKGLGDPVNLETDLLGKYIWRMLNATGYQQKKSNIDYNFLKEHGFA